MRRPYGALYRRLQPHRPGRARGDDLQGQRRPDVLLPAARAESRGSFVLDRQRLREGSSQGTSDGVRGRGTEAARDQPRRQRRLDVLERARTGWGWVRRPELPGSASGAPTLTLPLKRAPPSPAKRARGVWQKFRKLTAMLEIKNLHARVAEKEILKGISLSVKPGEVHAIMGPNGSGKSTLASVLAGRDGYEVTEGTVEYQGKDLLDLDADERAREGVFLAFQYPVEIPGVNNMYFLRASVNAVRKHRGEPELDAGQFLKTVRQTLKLLD